MKRILVPVLMFLCATTLPSWNVIQAPWRSKTFKSQPECNFCHEILSPHDEHHYILQRRKRCLIQLNPKPYVVGGHIMIIPYAHTGDINTLSMVTWLDMMAAVKDVCRIMTDNCGCSSFNVGFSVGQYSGATCESHIHVHVVPRWSNRADGWMEIITNTRVLDEHVRDTYKRLLPHFQPVIKRHDLNK